MRKRLNDTDLEYLKNNASRGSDFNKQLMLVQIENVYAQDELKSEIVNLNKTIIKSNEQSSALEKSNLKVQVMIVVLTFIATGLTVISSSQTIIQLWSTSFPNLKIPDAWLLSITIFVFDIFIFAFAKLVEKIFSE